MAKKRADLMQVAMKAGAAGAGGILAEVAGDLVTRSGIQWLEDNPKVGELAPAAIGLGLLYFMSDNKYVEAGAYGMIGASVAGAADDLIGNAMEGLSRVHMDGHDAEQLQAGIDYVHEMQGVAFSERVVAEETEDEGGMH